MKALALPEILRRQFRHFAECLTRHSPAQEPLRRTEETRGGFRRAAAKIVFDNVVIPAAAFVAASLLPGTLDWLNPWHNDMTSHDHGDEFQPLPEDHIYPHL